MKNKKKSWQFPITVSGIVLLVSIFLLYQMLENKKTAEAAARQYELQVQEETNAVTLPEGATLWNGAYYTYNENLSNFLFLGVDKEELADTSVGAANAGQTDAIFLLSWNRVDGSLTIVTVPRDTMTSYTAYDLGGEQERVIEDHISLAYAYGDGKHTSCRLTADAVSHLLYGVPIQGYCAVSLDALPVLMDALGGVEVIVPNDSLASVYPECQEGAVWTLNAENAESYLRYRDTSRSQTALLRLERQEAFLEGCAKKAKQCFQEDPGFLTAAYEALEPHMVTNIGIDQFARILEGQIEGAGIRRFTVPGEGSVGEEGYDEYHADDDRLYEMVMEIFYTKKSGSEG